MGWEDIRAAREEMPKGCIIVGDLRDLMTDRFRMGRRIEGRE
jgi:hypothetical protein